MNSVRQKKLFWVIGTLIGAIIAVALIIYAIGQQTDYYYDSTAIMTGAAPQHKRIRAGGMVVKGSVKRDAKDPVLIHFVITDFKATTPVVYRGILPDLFAENSGVVATGKLEGNTFIASEVLAKHDENYVPPEVAKSLKKEHEQRGVNTAGNERFIPATSAKEILQNQSAKSSD